jgi:hypothetical protein
MAAESIEAAGAAETLLSDFLAATRSVGLRRKPQ